MFWHDKHFYLLQALAQVKNKDVLILLEPFCSRKFWFFLHHHRKVLNATIIWFLEQTAQFLVATEITLNTNSIIM